MRTGALSASASLVAIAAQRRFGGALEKATAEGFAVQSWDAGGTPMRGIMITSSTPGSVIVPGNYRRVTIGGGGSGGMRSNGRAGGGGAGELVVEEIVALAAGDFTAVIGAGGAGISGFPEANGNAGGNTSWTGNGANLTAIGGGAGGGVTGGVGGNGGSGGGAPVQSTTPGLSIASAGVGFNGGIGLGDPYGGSGGGAGGAPPDDTAFGINPGPGVTLTLLGMTYTVCRGGDGNLTVAVAGDGYGSGSSGGYASLAGGDGLIVLEWPA
ncbi:hypothetical protein P2H44_22640 [Albimonas sp. CAU 1670]|uniref:glycine-rich domain-containing protein n=1 Tax=Albimonas sp. CAU 1670 TaxID=3032599 RepID=UPI0023D9F439|nr:hypothetical protein [Albimonas sp. CAU 1670]MDF2235363.1 hypothetical protein [Albimonas sp. CAU 1670]